MLLGLRVAPSDPPVEQHKPFDLVGSAVYALGLAPLLLGPNQGHAILTCQPIIMAMTASISDSLSDRIGSRAPATLGMLILSIGLFLLSRLDASTSVGSIAVMLLITGLGIGLFTSPNSSAILGAVPPQRRGVANGVLGTARTLGMVLGIGVAGAVYTTTLGLIGDPGADGVLRAAGTGLLVASGVAPLATVTSATRPGLAAGADPARVTDVSTRVPRRYGLVPTQRGMRADRAPRKHSLKEGAAIGGPLNRLGE